MSDSQTAVHVLKHHFRDMEQQNETAGFGMWLPGDRGASRFVDALEAGSLPAWLHPLPLPADSHALLFQVVDPAAGL